MKTFPPDLMDRAEQRARDLMDAIQPEEIVIDVEFPSGTWPEDAGVACEESLTCA